MILHCTPCPSFISTRVLWYIYTSYTASYRPYHDRVSTPSWRFHHLIIWHIFFYFYLRFGHPIKLYYTRSAAHTIIIIIYYIHYRHACYLMYVSLLRLQITAACNVLVMIIIIIIIQYISSPPRLYMFIRRWRTAAGAVSSC